MKLTLISFLAFIVFQSVNAQTLPTYSVTITPQQNATDVKGNIKSNGFVEASGMKVTSLATGNPYLANTVYANIDGTLVTGYKTGFHSIPPSVYRFTIDANNTTSLGSYVIYYFVSALIPILPDQFIGFLAPFQVPHKSKLVTMKLNFTFGGFTPKSIRILISKTPMNGTGLQYIKDVTTATSDNYQVVTAEIPLDLIEIDNENYFYNIAILPTTNWELFRLYGTSIEYRDL
jgi:hypothetical protein